MNLEELENTFPLAKNVRTMITSDLIQMQDKEYERLVRDASEKIDKCIITKQLTFDLDLRYNHHGICRHDHLPTRISDKMVKFLKSKGYEAKIRNYEGYSQNWKIIKVFI